MSDASKPNLPIGYWLRKADELLTTRIDEVQQANGLSRIEWQVLNVVRDAEPVRAEQIAATLEPFADAKTVGEVCDRLSRRGELTRDASAATLSLTERGRSLHAAALSSQQELRQRAMEGVSHDDYAITVRVLQRLVENLGGQ